MLRPGIERALPRLIRRRLSTASAVPPHTTLLISHDGRRRKMKRLHGSIVLALAIMLVPAIASAQERSSITGQVTIENTGQPLVGVQVMIQAANLRAFTDERGRFQLLNVPRGTHTLRAV